MTHQALRNFVKAVVGPVALRDALFAALAYVDNNEWLDSRHTRVLREYTGSWFLLSAELGALLEEIRAKENPAPTPPPSVLDLAHRMVELDAGATPAPWRWGDWDVEFGKRERAFDRRWLEHAFYPPNELVVRQRVCRAERVLCVDDDVELASDKAFIAESRAAAPALARFAILVDELTARLTRLGTEGDSYAIEYRSCAADLRRQLGLPEVTP